MILINFAIKYRDNMRQFILLISLLSMFPLGAWCEDGDTFVAQTPEGCSMTFTVISEAEKTACVGNEVDPAIDVETKGKITIPAIVNGYQVKRIGVRAFVQCNQIEEIVMPKGIISIGDIAFHSCEKLQSMNIPEGVKNIGEGAFAWCKELKSVTIPSSVTETEPWIFLECRNLQSVYSDIPSPSPVWIATFSVNYPPQPDNGTNNFDPDELYNQATLYVPKGCTEKYQNTEGWNLFTNIVEEVNAENIPFVQDGKRWKTTYYWGALNDYLGVKHRYHYDFVLEGDTIIKGEACKKMYVDSSLDGSRKEYLLSMYQEGQKVYFVPKDSQEGLLLYDFGAEVGDIIEVFTGPSINPAQSSYQYSPVEMRVLDVEMRMYHGVERRCLYVINESDYQSYVDDDEPFTLEDLMPESGWWIEGLGKEGYPFDNTQVGMMMGGGMSTWLCTVGTDTLYTNGTFDPTANQCLVDGGMSWIQEYSPGNSVSPEYRKLEKRHFYFKLDEERVMIAGHRCRYLHASVLGEEKNEHIVAALYEEDGKVWFYPWKGSEDAYLLYDFHANEGDVLTVGVLDYWDDFQEERDVQQRKCKVEKVTEEEFKGIKRRCLYLNEACNEEGEFFTDRSDENSCWIEGIGSLLGIEGNLPGAWMAGTPHQKLLDCSWMDDVYYHDDETIFPDAIQDVHIDKRNQHAKEVYYDLTGRPVSTPSKGIYIHNGKIVLVR